MSATDHEAKIKFPHKDYKLPVAVVFGKMCEQIRINNISRLVKNEMNRALGHLCAHIG